jgi:hypothetical protein
MAKKGSDDIIDLIIALADMIGTVAKNMKKILAIIRKKSKGIKRKSTIETITTDGNQPDLNP